VNDNVSLSSPLEAMLMSSLSTVLALGMLNPAKSTLKVPNIGSLKLSPDFRKSTINKIDMAQESALTPVLEKQGFSKEEIWKRIGRENDYEDQKNKFLKAKKESNNKERELKIRINEILKNPTKLY